MCWSSGILVDGPFFFPYKLRLEFLTKTLKPELSLKDISLQNLNVLLPSLPLLWLKSVVSPHLYLLFYYSD